MCKEHWVALHDELVRGGLESYMTDDGEKALNRLKDSNERGKLTLANFEPMMVAHNLILQNAVNNFGIAVIAQEGCPLCWMTEAHTIMCRDPNCDKSNFDHWIRYAVGDTVEMLEEVKEAEQK